MSIEEANRLSIMRQVDKKILNMRRASEALGASLRQASVLDKILPLRASEAKPNQSAAIRTPKRIANGYA